MNTGKLCCPTDRPLMPISDCSFDNSYGGLPRLVFLHCSVTFVDIMDLDEWCFYAKQGLLFITNEILGEKTKSDHTMRQTTSCDVDTVINKTNYINFVDYLADLVNFTHFDYWNFLQKNYKNYSLAYITCGNEFFGFVDKFNIKLDYIIEKSNADLNYWEGAISWRNRYEIKPILIPDLIPTIIECQKLYDPDIISQIPIECLTFGIVTYSFTNVTAFGGDGSINIVKVVGATTVEYSIDGGVSWTFNPIFQGLDAGTYTVIARDYNRPQCVSEVTETLIDGCLTNPTFNVTHQKIDKNGLEGGTVKLFITGGTGQFTITVNGTPIDVVLANQGAYYIIDNLESGNYLIQVKDNIYLCTNTILVTIIDLCSPFQKVNPPLVINSGVNNDGKIALPLSAISGGTAPYSVSIDNINYYVFDLNDIGTIENLAPGLYTLYVKDSLGCILIYTNVEVESICATFGFGVITTTGTGTNTSVGTITLNGVGGGGSYLYSIDGINYSFNNVIENLALGPHTVYIKSADYGCVASQSNVNIIDVCPLLTMDNPVVTASNATNNGIIVMGTVSGLLGTPEYSINGLTWQLSNTFNNVPPGTFTVYVRDQLTLCIFSITGVFVENLCDLIYQGAIIDEAGANNLGSITINEPVGGSGNYLYSIDGGNTYVISNIFTLQPAGDYFISIKDNTTLCTIDEVVTIPNACATFSIDNVSITASGMSPIGTIIIDASGSSNNPSNYEYSINGGTTYQASNAFLVDAGNYEIAVRDTSNGCVVYDNDIIVPNMCADLEIDGISIVGAGVNPTGSINILSVSGFAITPALKYSIYAPSFFIVNQDSPIFDNLYPNTYTINVLDNVSGCNVAIEVVVPNICNNLSLNAVATPSGLIIDTGTINIIAQGGSGDYSYSIDGGNTLTNTTGMFTAVGVNTYSLVVLDNITGCQVAGNVTVPSICSILQITEVQHVDSGVNPTGQITAINVAGGSGNFDFTVDATTQVNNPIFLNLAQGPHLLTVEDNDTGCTKNTTVIIGSACNSFDFAVDITGSGTTPSGQVSITNVTGTQVSGLYNYTYNGTPSVNDFANNLPQGIVSVIVTDAVTGCSKQKNLTIPNICPSLVFSELVVGSGSAPTGQVTIVGVNGGTGNYTYSIDALAPQASNSFSNVSQGSHIVRVIDNTTGCITDHVINVPSICNLAITNVDSATPGTIVVNTVTGNISLYTNLEYGLNNLSTPQTSNTFNAVPPGTYTVFVRDTVTQCTAFVSNIIVT